MKQSVVIGLKFTGKLLLFRKNMASIGSPYIKISEVLRIEYPRSLKA